MSDNDGTPLGDRMKGYENVNRNYLPRRTYTLIRVDGRAFHTYTRTLDRPYDVDFMNCMKSVMVNLYRHCQNFKLAYVQSDEVSVLLSDFDQLNTEPWFGGNIQKIASITASVATSAFNNAVRITDQRRVSNGQEPKFVDHNGLPLVDAMFDSRVWTIPEQPEVANYFQWRWRDAVRNSRQMLGQAHFSQRELNGINTSDLLDKLVEEKGVNWHDEPEDFKYGTFLVPTTSLLRRMSGNPSDWFDLVSFDLFHQQDGNMDKLLDWIPTPNVWLPESPPAE